MAATKYTAKVLAKGRITIPKPLREKYNLKKGSRVHIFDHDGMMAMVPLPDDPVEALHGMLAGGPSLTEELLTERAREESRRG